MADEVRLQHCTAKKLLVIHINNYEFKNCCVLPERVLIILGMGDGGIGFGWNGRGVRVCKSRRFG
eukprot:2864258-Amphidinium_carterae.1